MQLFGVVFALAVLVSTLFATGAWAGRDHGCVGLGVAYGHTVAVVDLGQGWNTVSCG
jgi:hypothetical protein